VFVYKLIRVCFAGFGWVLTR